MELVLFYKVENGRQALWIRLSVYRTRIPRSVDRFFRMSSSLKYATSQTIKEFSEELIKHNGKYTASVLLVHKMSYKAKAVPLHAMKALRRTGGIAPTHSRSRR